MKKNSGTETRERGIFTKHRKITIISIFTLISIFAIATYAYLASDRMTQNVQEKKRAQNKEIGLSEIQEAMKEEVQESIQAKNISQNMEEEPIIECESIMQGVQDSNLVNGNYTFRVKGKIGEVEETVDYKVELWNFYEDVHYTKNTQIGNTVADQRMLIAKYWGNLEIDSGITLTATTRKRGMYIHVLGSLENKGTITMTARGAIAEGQNVYLIKNSDETYEYIPSYGGNGGGAVWNGNLGASGANGNAGANATQRATGGGGAGGAVYNATSGSGSRGTSYSGGTGGGGAWYGRKAGDGQANGGAGGGGNGGSKLGYSWGAGGGAGNPGGGSQGDAGAGGYGTGGLLVIYAKQFSNQNVISSNGSNGGWAYRSGGGASGGGSINIFYNTNTSNETSKMTANGGARGTGTRNGQSAHGGAGGSGSITLTQVDLEYKTETYLNYPKKTIQMKKGQNIQIDKSKLEYISKDNSEISIGIGNIIYETLDESIAVVNSNGTIEAIGEGRAKIKIIDEQNEKEAYIEVTVVEEVQEDIELGENFTVALKKDGTVWSYGANDKGQLGIGNNENQLEPIEVELADISQLGAGYHHAIALTKSGEVLVWGDNSQKQLANETIENSNIAIKVEGLIDIIKVDAYKNRSIALTKDGEAYIWGEGYSAIPEKVQIDKEIVDISGDLFLTSDGKVYNITDSNTKLYINRIAKISCGDSHYLAVDEEGKMYEWNIEGYAFRNLPGLVDVTDISAGNQMSLARTSNGKAYIWGNNDCGQLGKPSIQNTIIPQEIELEEIEKVVAGEGKFSAIVKEDGYVWSTGLNNVGQLGIGDNTNKTTYVRSGNIVMTNNVTGYLQYKESLTITGKLEHIFNLKIGTVDENQDNFILEVEPQENLEVNEKTISPKAYGVYKVTLSHKFTGITQNLSIKVLEMMESLVQGIRDCELEDGKYEILVEDQIYNVELYNYYDDVTYSENTELGDDTTEYKTLIVKYHKNLTIEEGVTVTAKTINSLTYKKGMFLCVLGDIHNEGTISMTARGTYNCAGQNVYLWKNIDNSYEYVPAVGGAGGASMYTTDEGRGKVLNGNDGKAGIKRATGGGGTGGGRAWGHPITIGAGGNGSSYSGGSGSGAANCDGTYGTHAISGAGSSIGGPGGAGAVNSRNGSGYAQISIGGTGNPTGGYQTYGTNATNYVERRGTGGLLIMYADNLYNNGTIEAKGIASSTCGSSYSDSRVDPGGASGGGSINIFANIIENSNVITAQGGPATWLSSKGGAGGNGYSGPSELSSILNYPEKIVKMKPNEIHQIIESKISYIKLNDIQSEDIELGKVAYEIENPEIATISETGKITANKEGITKLKITDIDNENCTYVTIEVTEQVKAQIKEGTDFTTTLKENGTVWGYGKDISSEPIQIKFDEKIVNIGAGDESSIALSENGNVYIWKGTETPTKEQINNIKQVDCTGNNFYAIDKEGNAYIWGNEYTQPTKIETEVKVIEISGKLLLGEDGKVYTTDNPKEAIEGLRNVSTMAQGENHNLFLTVDGRVYSIGQGDKGQLGNGKTENKTIPIRVKKEEGYLENIIEISAGSKTSMALTKDGKAYVWGDNTNKKLGLEEEIIPYAKEITSIQDLDGTKLELKKIERVETGKNHSTILDEDGFVYSVGLNENGQLGIGDNISKEIYTKVGKTIFTTNKEEIRIGVGESDTLIAKIENSFNLKKDIIDDNQDNFNIEATEQDKVKINNKDFTGLKYGKINVTIRHTTNLEKDIDINVIEDMESIVQGFRDCNLPDGDHVISINGQDYVVELINYYDDVVYTEDTELGDDSTDYKTLVVKYHKNLTVNEGVTLTTKQADKLTYKKGMYICVLGNIYNNGSISMTGRGTHNVEGENVYLWKNIDDSYEYIPAVGGAGADAARTYKNTGKNEDQWVIGKKGENGKERALAGGGSGAVHGGWYSGTGIESGKAGTATSYSGGAGSGAVVSQKEDINYKLMTETVNENSTTGTKSIIYRNGSWNIIAFGGTGTINGYDVYGDSEGYYEGTSYYNPNRAVGTGGLITIYADKLYNNGVLEANGVNNECSNYGDWSIGGGASGGGSVNIFARIVEEKGVQTALGGISTGVTACSGGAGGDGSVTVNILSSILHYPEEKITIKTKTSHKLDEAKFYYEKLNDIQTEDLTVGKLIYEIENPEIATINEKGEITAKKEGITRVKVTDSDNYGYTTYINIEIIDQEEVYIDNKEILPNEGKEGYKDGTYYYGVPEETTDVNIKVVAGNEFATVSFNENTQLYQLEQNIVLKESKITEIPVTITSKDGIVYETVIYIEKLSRNCNIGTIKVNDEETKPEEGKIKKYIDETEDIIKIEIDTEHEEAKIVITDKDGNPILDENGEPQEYKKHLEKEIENEEEVTIYIKVISENGDESEVYEINVEKVSRDATLQEVYVKGEKIEANENGEYIAYVLDIDETAKVKAIANNKKADVKIAQGEEQIHIAEENIDINNHEELETPIEIPILVTPKLGTSNVSYLYIYKMSTSLELSNITIDGIKPNNYNEKTHTYTFLIEDSKTDLNLSAIAESKYTTLKYGKTENEGSIQTELKVEQTEEGKCFKILAESKAGTSREYKIDIIRKPSKDPSEDPSKDTIQYLKVNNKIVSKDPEGNYEIKLGDNIENIEIISSIISQTEKETGKSIDINNTGEFETPAKQVILEKENFEGKEEAKISIKVLEENGTIVENTLTIKFQKGTYIEGRILTENAQGKYIADITVYKLSKNTNKQTNTNKENKITVGNFEKEEIAKVKTKSDGTFKILVYMPGEIDDDLGGTKQTLGDKYEILVTKLGYLDYTVRGIKVQEEKVTTLEPYKLIAGDIMKTGEIELDDLVNLNDRYGPATKHPECDLNEDGKVDKIDREILKKNYTRRVEILNLDIKNKQDRLIETGDFILPLIGKYTITSNYGMRVHPITEEEKLHAGIDISGIHHTEILAVADGEITFCGSQNGYGNCIEIKHIVNGETLYSFYTHLSKIDEQIKVGNKVEQGQIIGQEGGDPDTDPNPGTSTGHHLHFEIRTMKNSTKNAVNPKDYIQF